MKVKKTFCTSICLQLNSFEVLALVLALSLLIGPKTPNRHTFVWAQETLKSVTICSFFYILKFVFRTTLRYR